jgi:predicted small lipoprotein YifL
VVETLSGYSRVIGNSEGFVSVFHWSFGGDKGKRYNSNLSAKELECFCLGQDNLQRLFRQFPEIVLTPTRKIIMNKSIVLAAVIAAAALAACGKKEEAAAPAAPVAAPAAEASAPAADASAAAPAADASAAK